MSKDPLAPDQEWIAVQEIMRLVNEHPERFKPNTPEELAAWAAKIKNEVTDEQD